MLPTIYRVKRIEAGQLSVMGRPRADEWAYEEFAGLAEIGVTEVISLLEPHEAQELGLSGESRLCASAALGYYSFPIPDRGQPESARALGQLVCAAYHRCCAGAHAVVHCRAGIGRSGLVAAAVLMHAGLPPEEAFSVVSKARGIQVPDTQEQADWLVEHTDEISTCHLVSGQ